MRRPYVAERWRRNSSLNSACCADESRDQLRANVSFASVSKSTLVRTMFSILARLPAVSSAESFSTAITASLVPVTTSVGLLAARPGVAMPMAIVSAAATARPLLEEIQLVLILHLRIRLIGDEAGAPRAVSVAHRRVEIELRVARLLHVVYHHRVIVHRPDDARPRGV